MNIKRGQYYRFDGPNGFTVKALDNSYGDTFRALVVLQGNYTHEVGHISTLWSITSFIESDLSEFLEEANKRYPMGSRYLSLGGDPDGIKGIGVSSVDYEAKIWYYNDELRGVDMGNFLVYNFCVDKWAEPINDQVDTEETLIEAEFDLTTHEGRLAYAKKHYPIGTRYIPLDSLGDSYNNQYISQYEAKFWGGGSSIEVGSGLIYHNGKWAEIIKENIEDLTIIDGVKLEIGKSYYVQYKHCPSEWKLCKINRLTANGHPWSDDRGGVITDSYNVKTVEEFNKLNNMNTQKLSRKGLKEIHSVACPHWKYVLEGYGSRNPLEDYIELYQEEVNKMFNACTKEQLPIVSKYLKQDDGSVNVMLHDTETLIPKRIGGEYEKKAFALHQDYNWEIKKDTHGFICLIPTKKK